MDKKKSIIIGVAVAVVVIAIVIFGLWNGGANNSGQKTPGATVATQPTSTTRAVVPTEVSVPDKGAATGTVAAGVAVPQVQAVTNPTTGASLRSFNITADNNQFTPNTVIVNQGDTVDILLSAVGQTYDFTQPDYGFYKILVPKGTTKKIEFGATAAGKFTFYCGSCGGASGKGPIGYIVVNPK